MWRRLAFFVSRNIRHYAARDSAESSWPQEFVQERLYEMNLRLLLVRNGIPSQKPGNNL